MAGALTCECASSSWRSYPTFFVVVCWMFAPVLHRVDCVVRFLMPQSQESIRDRTFSPIMDRKMQGRSLLQKVKCVSRRRWFSLPARVSEHAELTCQRSVAGGGANIDAAAVRDESSRQAGIDPRC